MGKFIDKIKQFFRNLFSKDKVKLLNYPEVMGEPENGVNSKNEKLNNINNQSDKKEFFEIYNKIKEEKYELNQLNEAQAQKIITMLEAEIVLKKEKLQKNITELNILKVDKKIAEKNRILQLYNEVKKENINLTDIDKEDLLKIRNLLLEEAKLQDGKLTDEFELLEKIKNAS